MKNKTSVAELIRQHRDKRGLTQKELAELLGFSGPQYISNIERGVAPLPARYIPKLTRLLGVSKKSLADSCLLFAENKIIKAMGRGRPCKKR